jgi:hypothetical protein
VSERIFSREWLEGHYVTTPFMSQVVVHSEELRRDEEISLHQVVIKDGGRFWSLIFEQSDLGLGLHDPWFGQDEMKAIEVYPVYRVVPDWREVEEGAPALKCRPLDADCKNSMECDDEPEWVMAYQYDGEARVTELCSRHLHESLLRNGHALDIREVKHR